MYEVVKTLESLSVEELQLSGTELKMLYARLKDLRIRSDCMLEIRLIVN